MKTHMHLVRAAREPPHEGREVHGEEVEGVATVRRAFEEFAAQTEKENPLQILVNAVENAAPREEVTRLQFGGISAPSSGRRLPARLAAVAIRNIAQGAITASHKSSKPIQAVPRHRRSSLAGKGDLTSYAVTRREEVERVAQVAR